MFAIIFREEKLLAGIAAVLGAAAIAVQVWWVVIIMVFAMIIANAFAPSCHGPFAQARCGSRVAIKSRIDFVIGTGRWVFWSV